MSTSGGRVSTWSRRILEQRLGILRAGDYNVLLGEALQRLFAKELPPRSVSITFDNGTYDFYKQAYPILKRYGFPVTVYQTTFTATAGSRCLN
jgi:peptidoglycan/xylan/chitin deacetylase (PgdA/CDA1 family)